MNAINSMLADCYSKGYTTRDLRDAVIDALSPYFQNETALSKYWTDAEMLSIFEFVIKYHYDGIFQANLLKVLDVYHSAYSQNPNGTLDIIASTLSDFSQKENIMFYKRNAVPSFEDSDYYQVLIQAMEHIGNTLEVGVKPIVAELWACKQLSLKRSVDYDKIREQKFGVIIQNLTAAHCCEEILRTEPQQLKLSDWRNIAYHHSYQISENTTIQCTYGKNNSHIVSMDMDELKQYTGQIIRSANTLYIARMLFMFDYLDMIPQHCEGRPEFHLSPALRKSAMVTSFLSQGFKLIKLEENADTATAEFLDILDTSMMSAEKKRERWIHVSQYQLFIWELTRKSRIIVNYLTTEYVNEFSCSVEGSVCDEVSQGKKDLSYIASQMKMEVKNKK